MNTPPKEPEDPFAQFEELLAGADEVMEMSPEEVRAHLAAKKIDITKHIAAVQTEAARYFARKKLQEAKARNALKPQGSIDTTRPGLGTALRDEIKALLDRLSAKDATAAQVYACRFEEARDEDLASFKDDLEALERMSHDEPE